MSRSEEYQSILPGWCGRDAGVCLWDRVEPITITSTSAYYICQRCFDREAARVQAMKERIAETTQ